MKMLRHRFDDTASAKPIYLSDKCATPTVACIAEKSKLPSTAATPALDRYFQRIAVKPHDPKRAEELFGPSINMTPAPRPVRPKLYNLDGTPITVQAQPPQRPAPNPTSYRPQPPPATDYEGPFRRTRKEIPINDPPPPYPDFQNWRK